MICRTIRFLHDNSWILKTENCTKSHSFWRILHFWNRMLCNDFQSLHQHLIGWSDGNSFVTVDYALLSAAKDSNLLEKGKAYDGRSLAGRRRIQSRRKATDVMLELILSAQSAGSTAKYVLFDSWFSSPKTVTALKKHLSWCHCNGKKGQPYPLWL